jgi:flagellum-specific peptidoglycan hydrolase FlgJ
MGDAELTPDEVTAWFVARNVKYRLSGGISIGDLVKMYFDEGKAEHVRPELAFAQSIIETGSFGNALDNNYAGIGACDSCNGEPAFPSPQEGVRGQIQLLRNYADPTSRAANLANPPSPTIYGNDPVAAAGLYDTFFAKGRTPTWNVMGNGNWATDPGYSQKVLTVYFQMVSFAAKHS